MGAVFGCLPQSARATRHPSTAPRVVLGPISPIRKPDSEASSLAAEAQGRRLVSEALADTC